MVAHRTSLLITIIALVMVACKDHRNDYSVLRTLPGEGWRYNDTLLFHPTHTDTIVRGNLAVAIRHNNHYPYSNLAIEVTSTSLNRQLRDTLIIDLTDDSGKWAGHGIGNSFQIWGKLNPIIHADSDAVTIRHIMRSDTLRGIEAIGLFLEKSIPVPYKRVNRRSTDENRPQTIAT